MRQILSFRLTELDSYYMMHMDKPHDLYLHDAARETDWEIKREYIRNTWFFKAK